MKAVCIHVALCGLVTAVVSGCDQPKPNCLTAQAPFVLKLTELSRSAGCTEENGPASFYADPSVGIAPYYARDKKGQPDYRKASFAIRTAEMATLVSNAEDHDVTPSAKELNSFGAVATEEPDANDLCRVPTLSDTRVVIPAVPAVEDDPATKASEKFPGQAAVDATLKWSDLNVYVTPDSLGTQVKAHLSDTRAGAGGSCTIEYSALGLAPAVPCYQSDDDGNPLTNADGTFQIDPTLCSPDPAPEKGRFSGSGISPTANVECSALIGYCVLAGTAFPALK